MQALCDTHCHIHDADYPLVADGVLANAAAMGVTKVVTMGSTVDSSLAAVNYANAYDDRSGVSIRVGVGVYPQETSLFANGSVDVLQGLIKKGGNIIGCVGEIGLDYYYDTVGANRQIEALEAQIQLALDNDLPMSFHVRSGSYGDAFADFWAILANFHGVRGVLHSFTDSPLNLEKVLVNGLMVGVNGIITFNRDESLNEVYRSIPMDRLVLETDSPYLAPKPYRGKTNQPCHIRAIAECVAKMRGVSVSELAVTTTGNASRLFNI